MRLTVIGPELRYYGCYAVIAVQRPDGSYVGSLECPNKAFAHEVQPEVRRALRDGAAKLIRKERSRR